MTGDEDGPDYEAIAKKCRACEARDLAAHDAHVQAQDTGVRLNGWYWAVKEVNGHG